MWAQAGGEARGAEGAPGGGWAVKGEGVRAENIPGGELCGCERSSMAEDGARAEPLKKSENSRSPDLEAFCFSFKITGGK